MAEAGIFIGNEDGTFKPAQEITRRQMANVLTRTLQVLFENGEIEQWRDDETPPTSNQTFTGTPGSSLVEVGTVTQFSFTGVTGSVVDIALVDCANISTDDDGVTTFPNSSNPGGAGNVADLSGVDADNDITVVNGTAGNRGQYADNVAVSNGTVTFSVTNTAPGCYVAVVFADADNDNQIDLGTDNQPTEAFGNSGDIEVVPVEAGDNSAINGTVQQVSPSANLFVASDKTYYYDANDEFLLEAGAIDTALTLEQFEARISAGDGITGTYRSAPGNQSTFTLNDIAPAAPTDVVVKAPDGTNAGEPGLEVAFTESTTPSVATYRVFRATATPPAITGQPTTCPSQTSGAYTQVGTVAADGDSVTGETVEFYDATAQTPAAGETQPQYCYYVVAVDASGDVGPNSATAGPATAVPGDTSGAPQFTSAVAPLGASSVTVNYDEAIDPASTDANASNYAVTVTRGGVTTALVEVSATDVDADTVTIAVTGIPGGTFQAGDVVVVTAQNGLDGNTVLDTTGVAQPVGDAVQATTPGGTFAADSTDPANGETATYDGNVVTLTDPTTAGDGVQLAGNVNVPIANGDIVTFEYLGPCLAGAPRVYVQGGAYNTWDADPAGPGACGADSDPTTWTLVTGTITGVTAGPAGLVGVVNDGGQGTIQVRNVTVDGVEVL